MKSKYIAVMIVIAGPLLFGLPGASKTYRDYAVIEQRNIFRPLWNISTRKEDNRDELEKARREEEQRQAELKKQEEQKALEAKKAELEQSLALSGVLFNGKKLIALITDRRTGRGGDYIVGDSLNGAQITAIDENTQTVVLDYSGKFQLTLRIANK